MKEDTRADKIFSSVLIALPVLALIFGLIPGFLPMYDADAGQYTACSLLDPPVANIMSNLCPLLLVTFAYTLILTVCYFRSQALGTIKAIFIFSVVCLAVSLMALLPEDTVKPMPYLLIPGTWAVMSIVSFVRMRLEIKRYDFD